MVMRLFWTIFGSVLIVILGLAIFARVTSIDDDKDKVSHEWIREWKVVAYNRGDMHVYTVNSVKMPRIIFYGDMIHVNSDGFALHLEGSNISVQIEEILPKWDGDDSLWWGEDDE